MRKVEENRQLPRRSSRECRQFIFDGERGRSAEELKTEQS